MNKTVINIKTDVKVKKQARKIASDLGTTLSGVLNAYLKQLIRDKAVNFNLNAEVPTDSLLKDIEEAKKDKNIGKQHSFDDVDSAIKFLNK